MKTKIVMLMLFVLMVPGLALAAGPYVISNPVAVGTDFVYATLDGGAKTKVSLYPCTGGSCFVLDVGGVAVGNHTVAVQACSQGDAIWGTGEACQSVQNFTFQRPALVAPNALVNIRLSRDIP